MDVRNAPRWSRRLVFSLAFVSLTILSPIRVMSAGETQRTSEDRLAERDIRDATQDLDLMHRILGGELQRLVSGASGAESADVATYLHEGSGKSMEDSRSYEGSLKTASLSNTKLASFPLSGIPCAPELS